MTAGDAESLRLLEAFFIPLSPDEAARRQRILTGSGTLTREMITRALGEPLCPVCRGRHVPVGTGPGEVPAFACPGPPREGT